MINRESADPVIDRESDGGDELSCYSSCGADSEFDKYCSANSAMGTPSFRSTSSYQDSEFGSSLRNSFRLRGENKNFGAKNEFLDLNGTERFVGLMGSLDLDNNNNNNKNENEEESDNESMFGCDSDEERNIVSYFGKGKSESKLFGNEKVDFGGDDLDDFIQESEETSYSFMVKSDGGISPLSLVASNSGFCHNMDLENGDKEVGSIQPSGNGKVVQLNVNTLSTNSTDIVKRDVRGEDVKSVVVLRNNDGGDIDELEEYLGQNSGYDIFEMEGMTREVPGDEELKNGIVELETKHQNISTIEGISNEHDVSLKNVDLMRVGIETDPVSDSMVYNQRSHVQLNENGDSEVNSLLPSSMANNNVDGRFKTNNTFSVNKIEDHFEPVKTRHFELNSFYDEVVNDMEDILLDSIESPGSVHTHGTRIYQSQFSRPSRDGGSSASISATDQQNVRIDRVEVVGSRQKEGDVSFSERLVGVRKYTVYKIRVVSGENNWEVERRYRDFYTLYHRLKKLFNERGWALPSRWSFVDKESRKLFGNASAEVIADRSILIQECLQSLINQESFFNSLNALICFLSPSQEVLNSSLIQKTVSQIEDTSTFGNTISLVVQTRPYKSMKQILDAQHYKCAGCYKDFDDGMTRVQGFVQALGWGKPRFCEYSGQLFCSFCHNSDTAILPAKVLHFWDFTRYPVSQLAKSYLDSIHDQPMLCVSAVNPFLFSKVPTLQQVANMRSRIRTMLPYVRCPFRGSIHKGLGSRRYLLESNDFFALRDLIDLSKGVFSALPVMVETVSGKILKHITEKCLICYDVGVPCSARQACDNTLSLIFPFQEGEVKKCKSCELVYHTNCFKKIATCPCGARTKQSANEGNPSALSNSNSVSGGKAEMSSGLLAGLFSMVIPQNSQILRREDSRRVDTDIIMASLPNTAL